MRTIQIFTLGLACAGVAFGYADATGRAEGLSSLTHLNDDERENAAERLAEHGEPSDIPLLLDRAIYDVHPGVRKESLEAIAAIGGRGAAVAARRALARVAAVAPVESTREFATRLLRKAFSYTPEQVEVERAEEAAVLACLAEERAARCAAEAGINAVEIERALLVADCAALEAQLAISVAENDTLRDDGRSSEQALGALRAVRASDAARIAKLESELATTVALLDDLRRELTERLAADVRAGELARRAAAVLPSEPVGSTTAEDVGVGNAAIVGQPAWGAAALEDEIGPDAAENHESRDADEQGQNSVTAEWSRFPVDAGADDAASRGASNAAVLPGLAAIACGVTLGVVVIRRRPVQ